MEQFGLEQFGLEQSDHRISDCKLLGLKDSCVRKNMNEKKHSVLSFTY